MKPPKVRAARAALREALNATENRRAHRRVDEALEHLAALDAD
ncbi:hypothetical protein [Halosegnis marinus]|uniref:Uncharacterized protein n=1 Tax=Halosegnis marinus TaxID=3034023 RepID=A0ABD5ZNW4_9EURY|nr:hypothetical protein [Halosegnis sp. DT85]